MAEESRIGGMEYAYCLLYVCELNENPEWELLTLVAGVLLENREWKELKIYIWDLYSKFGNHQKLNLKVDTFSKLISFTLPHPRSHVMKQNVASSRGSGNDNIEML